MIPEWLDLAAVVVGALAGVLVGQRYRLDLVGFVAMCLICALGGGLLRDTIMQVGTVYALDSYWAIPSCVLTALVGFLFPRPLERHPNLYDLVDIVSVALFVIAGTDKAIAYDLSAPAVVLMGTITGVGGGMLRDVFLGEIPRVFQQSNLYALCAVAGSVIYLFMMRVPDVGPVIAPISTICLVVALRRASVHYDIVSPADVDLEPTVKRGGKTLVDGVMRIGHDLVTPSDDKGAQVEDDRHASPDASDPAQPSGEQGGEASEDPRGHAPDEGVGAEVEDHLA